MFSKIRVALVVATLFISNYAHANIIDTVNLYSDVYGAYNNTIDETTNTSTTAVFLGSASGFGTIANIVFTDTAGIVRDVLSTANNDQYFWSWTAQQNSLVGTLAVATSATKVELLNNGSLTSYLADIGAINGISPIFCCSNDGVLNIATGANANAAVPEPTSIALLFSGFIGFNVLRRKASQI